MPARVLLEVEAPGAVRYLLGSLVMVLFVILPMAYAMLSKRRGSSKKYAAPS